MIVTRFAPSPTGELHLGHAAAALFAYRTAMNEGGTFLLRIEDIDAMRCKPEYVDAIYDYLHWLGIRWPLPVRKQSEHMDDYQKALDQLRAMDVLYPCYCSRREVAEEAAASIQAPHGHKEGPVYAGTCRHLSDLKRAELEETRKPVWRLDMEKALAMAGRFSWHDRALGKIEAHPERFGDIVLARRDIPTSYHLSVVVDDALQGVTLVTRGEDLIPATDLHRLLQELLDLPAPDYHHHPLLVGVDGKRLAKRDRAATLRALKEGGAHPQDVIKMADGAG